MKIQINPLISLDVEQIKISGTISVNDNKIPVGVNKTLDAGIISQLPVELIQKLTESVFGIQDIEDIPIEDIPVEDELIQDISPDEQES